MSDTDINEEIKSLKKKLEVANNSIKQLQNSNTNLQNSLDERNQTLKSLSLIQITEGMFKEGRSLFNDTEPEDFMDNIEDFEDLIHQLESLKRLYILQGEK